jgi:hypothetical protein
MVMLIINFTVESKRQQQPADHICKIGSYIGGAIETPKVSPKHSSGIIL